MTFAEECRTMVTLGQTIRGVNHVKGIRGHRKVPYNRLHTGDSGEREVDADAIYPELTGTAKTRMAASIKKTENLVRFGTVGVFDGPEVIDPQGLGA